MLLLFLSCILLIAVYYVFVQYQRRKGPPGPFPLPLIGNLVELLWADYERPCVALWKLGNKYGNVFMLRTGIVDNVVVNGFDQVKEVLTSECIDERIQHEWCLDRSYGSNNYGVIFSTGSEWKANRRYTQKTLKDLGFGKSMSVDHLILEEIQVLVSRMKEMASNNNGVLKIHGLFNAAYVNIIYSFLSGTRMDQNEPKLQELTKLTTDWFQSTYVGSSALSAWPFLKNWAPEFSGFNKLHHANVKLLQYFTNLVNEYRQKGDYKSNPRNFIEAMLNQIDEGPKHPDYDEPIFTDKNLIVILNDIFTTGSETTGNSTEFALRRLIWHPEIQKRIQDEIDCVVGRDRWVTLDDRPNLKYTEAFALEVLRRDPVAPAAARRSTKAFKFQGYQIPEGVSVLINYYSATMDAKVWTDPEKFIPERFLSEDGLELVNLDTIGTFFGYGRRDCMGQSIARSSLFVAIANFVQHFRFEADPVTGPPIDKYTKTITSAPVPFNMVVKIR